MRIRLKKCSSCEKTPLALYRCRYNNQQEWEFLCGKCLLKIKKKYPDSYQYGGTWKSKKR